MNRDSTPADKHSGTPGGKRSFLGAGTRTDLSNHARRAGQHTRFVAIMKFLLPVLALILVGLAFLIPSLEEEGNPISLEYSDTDWTDDKLTMNNPRFISSDSGAQQYVVTADSATQMDTNAREIGLVNIQADIFLANGDWLSLSAPNGTLDTETGILDLAGGIEIFSDTGNQIYAQTARVLMKDRIIKSPDGLQGHGPMGKIEADSLVANQLNGNIRFEGHVKMTLYP
ncbi:LPS export ABC transporter periplasmic protein LptC [Sneathiella chinensis]|uniref:LPS export ABC transporter periplasmic protein LptC n=1 Tax=Sneathiella chinensis TaxID=349750 RepID=A0ABQ5TZU6_9PROT|nr:LPS export ABC transporter periplasmic protein LptC [Sneathiella chinensis]GLQ04993.1 hypothetical protein GCM10007924_02140 [Sneathiella chinensis]